MCEREREKVGEIKRDKEREKNKEREREKISVKILWETIKKKTNIIYVFS